MKAKKKHGTSGNNPLELQCEVIEILVLSHNFDKKGRPHNPIKANAFLENLLWRIFQQFKKISPKMYAFVVLLVLGSSISCSDAFSREVVEGTSYLHRYNSTVAGKYVESTCHKQTVTWHNGTTLQGVHTYKTPTGDVVTNNYVALLKTKPKVHYEILKNDNGQLSPYCTYTEIRFGKTTSAARISSDCFYDAFCGSKTKIPTAKEIAEMDELCPLSQFKAFDQQPC